MRLIADCLISLFLTSCATIVNDANVPVALSFSDGSSGECQLSNKRVSLNVKIPSQPMVQFHELKASQLNLLVDLLDLQ